MTQFHLCKTLTLLTARRVLRRKSSWAFLAIGLAPCMMLLFWILAQIAPGMRPPTKPFGIFQTIHSIYFLSFYVPLVGLFLGLGVISDEIETKNITFSLTRPLHRYTIAVGRYLGHAIAAILLVAVSLVAVYLSNMLFQLEDILAKIPSLLNGVFVLSFGVATFLGFVALLGSLLKRFAMLIGLIWIIFDTLFSLVPVPFLNKISIRYRLLSSYWEMLPQSMPSIIAIEPGSLFINLLYCLIFVALACFFMGMRLSFEIVLSDSGK